MLYSKAEEPAVHDQNPTERSYAVHYKYEYTYRISLRTPRVDVRLWYTTVTFAPRWSYVMCKL